MNKRLASTVACLLLSATALTSLPALAATPNDQLVIGTSLTLVVTLDPAQVNDATGVELLANVYDRLVATEVDGKLVPQLAESWEADEESITFKLRDAKFSSGNPVTAKDVVWSLVRLMKMNQQASIYLKRVGYNADNIESMVEAVDDKTVRIKISDETVEENLLYLLAMTPCSIIDSATATEHTENDDYANGWLRTNGAGSGPFKLQRWTPNSLLILDANKDYASGAPAMNRVVFRHAPESQVQTIMLQQGDIDIAYSLSSRDLTGFSTSADFTLQQIQTGGFYNVALNAGNEYLSKPEVREAISYAIDYEGIQKAIVGPYGKIRTVPVPDNYPNAIPDPDIKYDPEHAKELLAKAGYPDGFKLNLLSIAAAPRPDMATSMKETLGKIGIDVNLQIVDAQASTAAHRERRFDMLMGQTTAYMPNVLGAMEQYASNPDNSPEANNSGYIVWRADWDIPELTALTAKAAREADPQERGKLYEEMQHMYIDLKPAILILFERFQPIVVSNRVAGFDGHPSQTRYDTVTKKD